MHATMEKVRTRMSIPTRTWLPTWWHCTRSSTSRRHRSSDTAWADGPWCCWRCNMLVFISRQIHILRIQRSTWPLLQPHLIDRAIIVDISPATGLGTSNTNIPLFLHSMKQIQISPDQTIHQARKTADEQLAKIIAEKPLRDFLITNLAKSPEDGSFRWRINLDTLERDFDTGVAKFPVVEGMRFEGPTLFIAGGRSDYIQYVVYQIWTRICNLNTIFFIGTRIFLWSSSFFPIRKLNSWTERDTGCIVRNLPNLLNLC